MIRGKAAITGMGCISALGLNKQANQEALLSGRRNPTPPSRFSGMGENPPPVFEADKDFFSLPEYDPALSPTMNMAMTVCREALESASYSPEDITGKRVGVIMGTTVGASVNIDSMDARARNKSRDGGEVVVNPDILGQYQSGSIALALARYFNFSGPCQCVVNACSSGADAIGLGASWIENDICDLVLAGGADALAEQTYFGFIRLMNTAPEPCKPFDVDRAGLNLGDAAAAVVLEAVDTKCKPIGYVLGYGTCCDAYHLTAPRPDALGLRKAISFALNAENVTPGDISFINTHGTGTANNDAVEAVVLRDDFPTVPFCATKGMTGHTLGAAGALEAVFTLVSLNQGKLPPSPGFKSLDPKLGVKPAPGGTVVDKTNALSLSLAFGGNNSALLLGSAELAK